MNIQNEFFTIISLQQKKKASNSAFIHHLNTWILHRLFLNNHIVKYLWTKTQKKIIVIFKCENNFFFVKVPNAFVCQIIIFIISKLKLFATNNCLYQTSNWFHLKKKPFISKRELFYIYEMILQPQRAKKEKEISSKENFFKKMGPQWWKLAQVIS